MMPCGDSILGILFLPYPLSPITAVAGGKSFSTPSVPVKSLHYCPSRRWSRREPPLLWQTLFAGHALLGASNQPGGSTPLVEAGRRGMGFDVSSVNHQHLWISTSGSGASGGSAESGGSAASDADNSEKIRSKPPLSHQRRQRLSRILWGPSAGGASTQHRPLRVTGMMPLNTLRPSTCFTPRSLGKRGGCDQPALR